MSSSLEVVILAHDHRGALEDLIDNVRFFVPEADVAVFNGGRDPDLTKGLGVETCSASRPLRLGNLVPFHARILRRVAERGGGHDFHVVLDSDQLFTRPGFAEFLDRTMAHSEFMAGGYLETPPGYYPEWDEVRRINYSWKRQWQRLYDLPHPSWGFNPGTVFRREFATKVLRFENTEAILRRGERSRLYGIEEFVFSTLARRLDCNPVRHPGSLGLVSGYPSPETFARCLEDPNVYMIHKVGMELDAPDRRIIGEIRHGRQPDLAPLSDENRGDTREPRVSRDSWARRGRERLKDLYFRFLP